MSKIGTGTMPAYFPRIELPPRDAMTITAIIMDLNPVERDGGIGRYDGEEEEPNLKKPTSFAVVVSRDI